MRSNHGRYPTPPSAEQIESVMARHARNAKGLPTSTEPLTGSGVLTLDARLTPRSPRDDGSQLRPPMPERIRGNTGTVQRLEEWASYVPETTRAAKLVRLAFAEPHETRRPHPALLGNANIDGQLSYAKLAALAREWDGFGASTPTEFVEALCAEVVGHPKYESVSTALRDISYKFIPLSQEPEPKDEYTTWRYGDD